MLLTNIGTADGELILAATDTEEGLTIKFPRDQQPRIAAKSTIEVPIEAVPKQRPWVGPDRSYDFVVTARRPANGEAVGSVNGQLIIHPRFASLRLVRRLVLLAGLLVVALVAFLMLRGDRNVADAVHALAQIAKPSANGSEAAPTVPAVVAAGGGNAVQGGGGNAVQGGGGNAVQSGGGNALAGGAPAPAPASVPTPAAPAVTQPMKVPSAATTLGQFPGGVCSPPQRPPARPAQAPAAANPSAVVSPSAVRRPTNDLAQGDPTTWWYCVGVTADQLSQALQANQARLVDVQVEMTQPTMLLSAVMVANQGPYARAAWWYFGLDDIQVQERLTSNNARPIALKAYDAAGQTRFVVVMVSNTAPDHKNFWWFPDLADPKQVDNLLTVNKARLTEVDPFSQQAERHFAVVMISNTGADQLNSLWAEGTTTDKIGAEVTRVNGQVVELEPVDARGTTFDVIIESCPCPRNWWATGLDDAGLANMIAQTGGRITSLATYLVDNQRRFAVSLIDNT